MKKRVLNKISKMVCLNARNKHLTKSSKKYYISCLRKYNRQRPFVYERNNVRLTVHIAKRDTKNITLMTKVEHLNQPKILYAPFIMLDGAETITN